MSKGDFFTCKVWFRNFVRNTESLKVLYIFRFVLRAEKLTTFEPKACFPLGEILRAERHFPQKLCSHKVESSHCKLFLSPAKCRSARKIPPTEKRPYIGGKVAGFFARNTIYRQYIDTISKSRYYKREMFSQKSVRRFVGDSSAFVSIRTWR